MIMLRTSFIWMVVGVACFMANAGESPAYGSVAIGESARQFEEQFIGSLFNVYGQALTRGDDGASVAIERFYDASAMEAFSVRSFANVLSIGRMANLLGSSQLEITEVVFDLMSVLYAAHTFAVVISEEDLDGIGPVFYDQADVPMTVINQINRKAIEAMEPDERDAVLLRIREVDRNVQKLKERRQAIEIRPRFQQTARWLFGKYLARADRDTIVMAIARRTEADGVAVRAWLDELEVENRKDDE